MRESIKTEAGDRADSDTFTEVMRAGATEADCAGPGSRGGRAISQPMLNSGMSRAGRSSSEVDTTRNERFRQEIGPGDRFKFPRCAVARASR